MPITRWACLAMLVLYVVSNNMRNYQGIAHVIHITQIFIFTHDVALATCTYNVVNTCTVIPGSKLPGITVLNTKTVRFCIVFYSCNVGRQLHGYKAFILIREF